MSYSEENDVRPSRRHIWLLAAAFAVAATLRLWGFGDLILLDDEFHALRAAWVYSFKYVFTHFGEADYCIPLALGYKVMGSSIGLSEWAIRLPMLVSGLLFCGIVPLLVYPVIRTSALGWIIAIAPFHIFYSRYARPYGISLMLGLLAVFSLWRAIRSGNRRWIYVAAPCAILAPWFHLSFLPPLVAVGAVVSVWAFTARGRNMRGTWFGALGIVLVGWCLLLVPPLVVDSVALSSKSATSMITANTLNETVELVTGLRNHDAGLMLIGVAILGLYILCRREPWLGLLLILAGGTQLAVVLVTQPAGLHVGVVLARYTMFCYALYLIALAATVGWAVEVCAGWRRGLVTVLLALLCVVIFLAGPLPRLKQVPAEWRNHCLFQYRYGWADEGGLNFFTRWFTPDNWSPFYATLRQLPPGSVTLLEAPWYYEYWRNSIPFYQMYHRQHTAIGFVGNVTGQRWSGELPLDGMRGRFHHFEELGSATFNQRVEADFLVIHKSWLNELPRMTKVLSGSTDASPVIAYCREHLGQPHYEDDTLVVFPLKKQQL